MKMTEEDTFFRLKRPLYSEMQRIWGKSELYLECDDLNAKYGRTEYLKMIDAFFGQYGWLVSDYSSYWHKDRND